MGLLSEWDVTFDDFEEATPVLARMAVAHARARALFDHIDGETRRTKRSASPLLGSRLVLAYVEARLLTAIEARAHGDPGTDADALAVAAAARREAWVTVDDLIATMLGAHVPTDHIQSLVDQAEILLKTPSVLVASTDPVRFASVRVVPAPVARLLRAGVLRGLVVKRSRPEPPAAPEPPARAASTRRGRASRRRQPPASCPGVTHQELGYQPPAAADGPTPPLPE